MSLNGWLYVYANPVNLTDPSGHDAWWCDELPEPERTKCRQRYYSAMVQLMVNSRQRVEPTATSTQEPPCTPTPLATATVLPDFDPQSGPILPRTDWRYYDSTTQTHLNDKRIEFSSTVLYWLRYYEGSDSSGRKPAWWKKSVGTGLDNLDFEKIKAFILNWEGGVFANFSFKLDAQGGAGDDAGWTYETNVHPINIMAGAINEQLDPLFQTLDHQRIAEGLAAYTAFFSPASSRSGHPANSFTRDDDWDMWLKGPQPWAVKDIGLTQKAYRNANGELINTWWQEREIQCRSDPYTSYTYVWRLPQDLRSGDTGRVFAGTQKQFANSCVGPG